MSDELKPFAWCYQTIAGVIVFQKWPASDKEWAQRNNDVAGATKYPNAHSVTDLYTAADLAILRTQLAAVTAERDVVAAIAARKFAGGKRDLATKVHLAILAAAPTPPKGE